MIDELKDVSAERAVLAGIYKFGQEAFIDVSDIIQASSFTIDTFQALYRCMEHIFQNNAAAQLDVPSIYSAANALGYYKHLDAQKERKLVEAVVVTHVERSSIRRLAAKIRKLEIASLLHNELSVAQDELREITGEEAIGNILRIAENRILDFSTNLTDIDGGQAEILTDGLEDLVDYVIKNPVKQLGLRTGFDKHDRAIGGGYRPGTVNVLAARIKQGKAVTLDTLIHTPTGPKPMREIRVGDMVCSVNGSVTKVIGVYPQGEKDIYLVSFSDGDKVECCEEHLWEVTHYRNKRNPTAVKTVSELKNDLIATKRGQRKWSVKLAGDCFYEEQDISMPAYLLGVLLGDGSFRSCTPSLTSADKEIVSNASELLENGYKIKRSSRSITYLLSAGRNSSKGNHYKKVISDLGLWGSTSHHKFVPDVYKYNSSEIRLAILQGLMDTDGHVSEQGWCEYSTTSLRLAEDVKFLVQSLNGLCSIKKRKTSCDGKYFWSYRLKIRSNDLSRYFRLTRKKNRCVLRKKPALKRWIDNIQYVGKKQAQCITVESGDGLYLVGDHVVTHNSHWCNNVAVNVAEDGIPVLYCDTEMGSNDQKFRTLARFSEISINDLETGQFAKDPTKERGVRQAARKLKGLPYHYKSVAGMPFEEILAFIRRWLVNVVGLDENGKAKPCLVIYDYLKLMDDSSLSKNIAEYQALGFMVTGMHNFAVKYGIPFLACVQLNRDGIDKEDSSAISQSDRIAWLCSNLTILKKKSEEELADSTQQSRKYNRKLVVLFTRHGPGLDDNDYINLETRYDIGLIKEGPYKNESPSNRNEGFVVEDSGPIPFGD